MGVLVDDLLFLARSARGRPIAREPFDLARVAADAVQDARAADPSREIGLDAPGSLVVVGGEGRVRQVLANLLSNALTHTPEGSAIQVRASQAGGWAELAVADHGPGLTPDESAHIFEAFYRADPARGRSAEANGAGTGLGLAIVAAIAEAHGGSASVTSEPGVGATFTVRLPVVGPLETTTSDGPSRTANTTRLEFQHVLVTNVQTIDAPVVTESDDGNGVLQVTGSQFVVTLALSPEQSERFVFAAEFGHIWLSHDPATVSDDGTRLVTLGNVYSVVQ